MVDSVRSDLLAAVSNTRPLSQSVTALTLILFQVLNGPILSAGNLIYFYYYLVLENETTTKFRKLGH
jgi:hypothetical protein